MFCGSRGSKSRLAKAAGAETSGQMRDQKLHSAVARSTYRSERVEKNSAGSEHVWYLRCLKSTSRRGAKHMLLEVEVFKQCTPLWREAHFEVKLLKARHARTTFGR